MQNLAIRLYERLKDRIGSEEATLLIDFIDERVKGEAITKEDIHAITREVFAEISLLREDIHKLKEETKEDIHELKEETKEDIHELKEETKEDIHALEKKTFTEISSLKEEIQQLRKETKEEIYRLDKRVSDLEWKMKLYFILLAVLIVITRPGVLEFFGKIIGVVR